MFSILQDENSNKMKNLDTASRQLLPRLQQFVSLLGNGSAVCDSRANSGLPACSIRGDSSLETATKVLPYLFSLLSDTQTTAKFLFVSDQFGTTKTQGIYKFSSTAYERILILNYSNFSELSFNICKDLHFS